MRIDERELMTQRERLGHDSTIRASSCISANELAAMRDQVLPEARRTEIAAHLTECAACREFMARSDRAANEPTRVGRYLIRHRLGAGGMGVVYEAIDPHLDRRIAIKIVRPEHIDDDARRRLLREARAAAKISHPNVVTVHDVGEHDDQVFVATELVDGETMATWQVGRAWRVLIPAWIQVARGLAAAHVGGIVHRDVKPSNVLVGRDGRVRIGDFGVARDHAGGAMETATGQVAGIGQLTLTGLVSGTPGYMAPEQLRGVVDARSDQFALCVAIVEGLTGIRPAAGAAPELPGVPGPLRDALIRGLGVDPSARFATMAELADALAQAFDAPAPPVVRSRSMIAIPMALGAVGATIASAVLFARTWSGSSSGAGLAGSAQGQQALVVVGVPVPSGGDSAQSTPIDPPSRASGVTLDPPDGSTDGRVLRGHRTRRGSAAPPIDDKEPASAEELLERAKDFERSGQWDKAREAWQRLEKIKHYRSEALYRQAWAAFQVNDTAAAAKLALQGASESGPYQISARFLYGDALYRQGEFERAKEFYLSLRKQVGGEDRVTATKKIAACNRTLNLPDDDGISN